jgi:hypothetical protein
MIIFSCDANNFQISRSQKRVIQNMNLFINENIKPGDNRNRISSNNNNNTYNLNQWIQTEPSTRAIQLIRHLLINDTRRKRLIYLYSYLFAIK